MQGFSPSDGPFSQHLVNVYVINGEGDFREFDIETTPEHFDLFRSHLGLCGVVIRMTFRVSLKYFKHLVWNATSNGFCVRSRHTRS